MGVVVWAVLVASVVWAARAQSQGATTAAVEALGSAAFDGESSPVQPDKDLVNWAARMPSSYPPTHQIRADDAPVFLVIGVKTSVIHHFPQRQAIRETWANANALRNLRTRVVFLGCESDLSLYTNPSERQSVVDAIVHEKRVYGDLLTSELHGCVDSYAQLLHKVVGFMDWVMASIYVSQPLLRYVMVVDDDVYLRVNRVVDMLRREATPKQRFYAGYVFHDLKPQRDARHKNRIPVEAYPLSTLPPFVGGPHYVVSIDLVQYVARNRAALRGLRALDDVSFALWFLAVGVRPTHIPEFILLRAAPCHDQAIALADFSIASVYRLHQNILQKQSLCNGVDAASSMHRHRGIVLPDDPSRPSDTFLTWELFQDPASNALLVGVAVAVATREVTYEFVPAATAYEDGLCATGANLLQSKLYITVGNAFCAFHRRKLHAFIDQAIRDDRNLRAMLTLPRHNLAVTGALVKTVGLSKGAKHARIFIECVMVEMYPTSRILVLTENAFGSVSPNIWVFSNLDDITDTFGGHSGLVMIAGDASVPGGLDPRVTVITTRVEKIHCKQLHLPVAVMIFAESSKHAPLELLHPYASTDNTKRKFCAYGYDRCERLEREYAFDLLNEIESVDALGACQGTKQHSRSSPTVGGENIETMDAMIATYTQYRFVVAFEDTDAPGHITEKIVAAFLAGAVPIYYGHSHTVRELFNRDAYINCEDFDSLRECVALVRNIHESPAKYEAMQSAPPVANRSAFIDTFGWHPVVADAKRDDDSPVRWVQQLKQLLESD